MQISSKQNLSEAAVRSRPKIVTWVSVILIIFLAAASILVILLVKPAKATEVEIYQNGSLYKILPLNESYEEKIIVGGHDSLTIKIENGKAWVKAVTCPDKLCVKRGKIWRKGEVVECLPHRVLIVAGSGNITVV